jgi:hypothetical protein
MLKRITLTIAMLTTAGLLAQTPAPTTAPALQARPDAAAAPQTIPPPVPPILATYRFWPEQFVQWVGNELPYSMVELDVDEVQGKTIYDVVLTDRATQKRIHYSNTPLVVAAVKAQDLEGYLANDISFERPEAVTTGATFTLHLTLHDGKPLEWRFIQGSDMMERGGGLTAFPDSPVPVFSYREQAAVAGEGTALQIGDAASPAEMWKEISKPPYFTAWHGAYSLNATTLVLSGGEEKWTIASAPSALSAGAVWKLTTTNGREMNILADKVDGHHALLTVSVTPGTIKRAIDADWDGTAWHYNQVRYIPHTGEKAGLTLQFAPALPGDGPSNLDISIGKKKIVTASIAPDAAKQLAISFKSPDWVKAKSLSESVSVTSSDLTLQAAPH